LLAKERGMGTEKSLSPTEARRRKRVRPTRAERFAKQWAPSIHAELLAEWGRRNDGAMPTLEDAEELAAQRVKLLVDGLGELAELSPKVMDLNEKSARPGRRGWRRNAWSRERRFDSGPRWWFRLFGDDEE
jgi:hypothetical protein